MRTQLPARPCRRPAVRLAPGAAIAQQLDLPRPSPNATVSQTVGVTEITIKYSRPGVKDREIWGKLVPYGEVWRTGANENTTIKFSTPVKVDGHELPAGTYGLQTIPTAGDWTVIFSKDANEWGAFTYKQADDALRIQAKPQPAEFRERMAFDFDDVTDTAAKVVLHWEKLKVPFTVEVDTPKLVAAKIKEAVSWQAPFQAASYCIQNNICLDDASRWLDASIALEENYANLRAKAHAARQEERSQRAANYAERALAAAKTAAAGAGPLSRSRIWKGVAGSKKERRRGSDGEAVSLRGTGRALGEPGPQIHHLIQAGEGLQLQELLAAVPAGADADRVRPRAPRHLQVVGGVADHHRFARRHAQLVEDVEQHLGVGLREGLVDGARGVEERPQARLVEGVVEPAPALAGRDRQQVPLVRQVPQQLADPGEEQRHVAVGRVPVFR